jgi:FemAB-related protein (PEP-CTERM system-associated)
MTPAATATDRRKADRIEAVEAGDAEAIEWNTFLSGEQPAPRYLDWEWGKLFARELGVTRRYLMARDGGVVRAVLPLVEQSNPLNGRFLTSLPFVNYGGPCGDPEAVRFLLGEVERLVRRRRAAQAEFRCEPGVELDLPRAGHKVRVVLDLPGSPERLWKSLGSKVRSQVRRPGKEGMEAIAGGAELIPELYELLELKWRQLGSPLYRRGFFEAVMREFPERATAVVVRHSRRAAAAGLLYSSGGVSEMVWAASRRELDRFGPNMLLYWTALECSILSGCSMFDFGRSNRGAGTERFKLQWGSRSEELPWYYILGSARRVPEPAAEGRIARTVRAIWSKLPLAFARALGPVLARRVPL